MNNIKIATIDDLDTLLKLSEEFYYNTPYETLEFNLQKTAESISKLIEMPNETTIVLLLNNDDGFLIGHIVEPLFSKKKIAAELGFYVRNSNTRGWLKLFKAYQYWANKMGCTSIQSGSLKERYGKFLIRDGFNEKETVYQKDLV